MTAVKAHNVPNRSFQYQKKITVDYANEASQLLACWMRNTDRLTDIASQCVDATINDAGGTGMTVLYLGIKSVRT